MKLLSLDKENRLKNYLKNSNTENINLLIKEDGTFDASNLEALKSQILKLLNNYIHEQPVQKIKDLPPIEWHPYDENLMVDSKILLLGTFPPPSYLIEKHDWYNDNKLKAIEIGSLPDIPYFYGNMSSLWKILEIDLSGLDRLEKKHKIINELRNKDIHISDIILACQREILMDGEQGNKSDNKSNKNRSADSNLYNIVPNLRIIDNLLHFENLDRIIFTSSNWDIQKKGAIADNSSTMGIFLKILNHFYQVQAEFNNNWYNLNELSNNDLKQKLFVKYKKQSKKNKGINVEFGYKAPNFIKIRINKNGNSKELILIGLPSPSGMADQNLKNTIYFKLWKKYKESEGQICRKEDYRKDLYKLGFSKNVYDIETLFRIQSIDISKE